MNRQVLRAATLTALIVSTLLSVGGARADPTVTLSPAAATNQALLDAHARNDAACDIPAPTTATGYTALWATLPVTQWGAADGSLSVVLGDGRVVWFYGDTFTTGTFHHSTAIVQNKGCLHVSNKGAQVIPNGTHGTFTADKDSTDIEWIHTVVATGLSSVVIVGRGIKITGNTMWSFADTGWSQRWLADVNPDGDLINVRADGPSYTAPNPDPGPMLYIDARKGHFGYGRLTHPWAKLASGKTLVTTCQNWDDGTVHPFKDYRPIWSETP